MVNITAGRLYNCWTTVVTTTKVINATWRYVNPLLTYFEMYQSCAFAARSASYSFTL